jgi:hypothetical protein
MNQNEEKIYILHNKDFNQFNYFLDNLEQGWLAEHWRQIVNL